MQKQKPFFSFFAHRKLTDAKQLFIFRRAIVHRSFVPEKMLLQKCIYNLRSKHYPNVHIISSRPSVSFSTLFSTRETCMMHEKMKKKTVDRHFTMFAKHWDWEMRMENGMKMEEEKSEIQYETTKIRKDRDKMDLDRICPLVRGSPLRLRFHFTKIQFHLSSQICCCWSWSGMFFFCYSLSRLFVKTYERNIRTSQEKLNYFGG